MTDRTDLTVIPFFWFAGVTTGEVQGVTVAEGVTRAEGVTTADRGGIVAVVVVVPWHKN
jgi:hypothetical protein